MTTLPTTTSIKPSHGAEASPVRTRRASHGRTTRFGWAFSLVSVVVVCFAWWALLAPPQLGGRTSTMITEGVSMLPHYHAGDVVVLRRESTYHVGEVAAYHNAQLKAVVMHRIVAIDGDHYVFKGDNNDYADSYEPTGSQIIGAERLHFPGAAKYVVTLHEPIVAAGFLALLWVLSSPPSRSRRQRRRHRHAL